MSHDPGNRFRPSNSDDGFYFIDKFCVNCVRGKYEHTQDTTDNPCEILSRSFLEGETAEWVYDEQGHPTCTHFKRWKWEKDGDGNWIEPAYVSEDPNQLKLPL